MISITESEAFLASVGLECLVEQTKKAMADGRCEPKTGSALLGGCHELWNKLATELEGKLPKNSTAPDAQEEEGLELG